MEEKEVSILNIPTHQLTPGMRQYQEAKQQNPDCIIMLRMGDFYELFYEDAVTAARDLDITLTARGKGEKRAPLAGVPYHALDTYLGRLVKKGHKVAIIEQLEDPKKAKGLVKRGLVRIVTPGTVIESSLLNETENNYIVAITQDNNQLALAYCDLSTGEFITSIHTNPSSIINELTRLQPSEVIIPISLQVNKELTQQISQTGTFLNTFDDYNFKTETAKQVLINHFQTIHLEQPLHISTSGALLSYLIATQKNSLSHLKNISITSNQIMHLDSSTFRNLEITNNMKDNTSKNTLLSILDKTTTAMGARLLKKWLKQPLLHLPTIQNRLNALQELNQSVIQREELILIVKNVLDLERLIGRVNYGTASPRDLKGLQQSLQQIPQIKEKLTHNTRLLKTISEINSLIETTTLLQESIKEEPPITVREGNIIKQGYNQELDELRNIKNNSKQILIQIENREKQKTNIPTLKIKYNRVFGYFIEVTKKNIHLVPETYIRKQTTANGERYITEELKLEEEKILGAEEKIKILEFNLYQSILKQVAKQTTSIQDAAQKIAALDVLLSLAKVSLENNYTKPEFVQTNILQIKNGRHPVIEKIEQRFIPNNVLIENGEMMVITGPNTSGKSTVMRQTALIVLMAQIGCYVPAQAVTLSVTDRIFTRVGAQDDLAAGQSTFMVEMIETANILQNATQNSLIILDEIGRGTSTFDGVSIAWSVAEHIYNNIKAKTMFATHYHVINKLADKFDKIRNYNVAVKEIKGEIIFLRKLIEGGTDQSHGIHVAKLAGLPNEVIERAKEIQIILEKDDDMVRRIKAKKLQEQMSLGEF
jgi:DNA mismatch repair protein MutS